MVRRLGALTFLTLLVLLAAAAPARAQSAVMRGVRFDLTNSSGTTLCSLRVWTGDPEGALTSRPCDFVISTNGKVYQKAAGTGTDTTGYVQVGAMTFTGDVTGTGAPGSVTLTIAGQAVTFAKFQNINTSRLLGRSSGGSGSVEEISVGSGCSLAAATLTCTGTGGDVTAASTFGTTERVIVADGTGRGVKSSACTISSGALTTCNYDVEGSGNTFTITTVEKYVPAGCQAGTASLGMSTFTALAPTAVCITGSNITRGAAQFPDSDGEFHLALEVNLVPGWTGTADFSGFWRTAATSGDIVLQIQWACTADAEVLNDTWSTAATTTETAKGTTLQINAWSITGVSLTGCADGELLALRIMRQRTHASDTLSGTFDLLPFYGVFRSAK